MYYIQYVEMNLCRLVGDDFKHFSKDNIPIFRKIFAYPNVHRTPDLGFSRPGFWYVTLFQLNVKGMVRPVKCCMV